MWVMGSVSYTRDDSHPPLLPFVSGLKDDRECVIRPMTEDDAEEICAFLPKTHVESDFLNYLPGEFKKTIEDEKKFIREHNAKPCSISMAAVVQYLIQLLPGRGMLRIESQRPLKHLYRLIELSQFGQRDGKSGMGSGA